MIELMTLASYAFVMSVTPGPNNIMLTVAGANFGYRRTLPHILGIGVGHSVHVALVCLGLGTLFQAFPMLQTALKVIGTAYLLYLAWKLLGSAVSTASNARPLSFWQAAAFQFVNPKAWVTAITVATVFIPADAEPWRASLLVGAIVLAVNFPCVSLWALFGVSMRRCLTDARRRLGFNLAMGLLLVATAAMVLAA